MCQKSRESRRGQTGQTGRACHLYRVTSGRIVEASPTHARMRYLLILSFVAGRAFLIVGRASIRMPAMCKRKPGSRRTCVLTNCARGRRTGCSDDTRESFGLTFFLRNLKSHRRPPLDHQPAWRDP